MTAARWLGLARWPILWVVVVATAAYGVSLGGDFVYDDVHSVADNVALRSLTNIPAFFVDVDLFSSLNCRLYRPVLLTSFALDAAISGVAPWMFKLTNLLIHISSAALVASLAGALGSDRPRAVFGACLFAAHPLASEAINTVSGRSNLLMVMGLLGAMRCHLASLAGVRWASLGTFGFAAMSLGCKEPAMILPVLLLILEWLRWVGDSRSSHEGRVAVLAAAFAAGRRVLPVVLLVIGYVFWRAHLLGAESFAVNQWQSTAAGGGPLGSAVESGFTRGMATQLATMALLLPATLHRFIVPYGMTMDPVIPYTSDFASPAVIGGVAVLVLCTGLGLRAPRRHPQRFLGTCLAWGCALPWVIKPLNHPYLEHRLYGVLAGLALCVVSLLPRLSLQQLTKQTRFALALGLVLLVTISARRSLEFSTREKLWAVELARNPDSKIAMAGMAVVQMQRRQYQAARPLLERLVELYPERRDARMNLVELELQSAADGDPHRALRHANILVENFAANPFYRLLHSRALAAVGARTGEARYFDAAVNAALSCLEIAAPKGLVYRTAAAARRRQGDLSAALALLDRSVARGLAHSSVLLDRGGLLSQLGRKRAARRDFERARQTDPFNGRILAALRDLDAAPAVPAAAPPAAPPAALPAPGVERSGPPR